MKNKIFKLGLFSLLSLGALATVSATFTNKTSIAKNEVSLNTTKKFTTNPTTGNREWILEQDEEINEDMFSDEPIDLYLQGHILKITGDHYLKKRFGDLNIYDYKGEEPEVKPIHKFKVNENYHYWELDEDNGDIEVSGGVIYAAGHSTTQPMITTTSASINLYGGTVCGSGTAAFYIYYNSALFTMYGGAIRGNSHYSGPGDWVTGAAVCVRNYDHDPSFVMNGGVISDNYAYGPGAFGGAAVGMIFHSHFTMNGGQIINNITDASESEVDAYGGAIYADATGSYGTSSITINGGEISNNKIIAGSKDAYGGAIGIRRIDSPVTINGGIISNNTLSSESGKTYGGGIYGYNLQIHGGEISNNIADYGGGIYACDYEEGTHTTSLEVDEDKELLITNNTANIEGGGMIIKSPTNNISGKVIIKNNNPPENDVTDNSANLHLYKSMTVTGPLDGSDIHFSGEPATGESLKIMDYVKSGSTRVNEFFHYDGDDDKYIDFDDDGNIEVVQIPEGEAHTIVAEPCDPSEGSIVANYDTLPEGKPVNVIVTPNKCHALEKLVYNDGTDHDITQTKSFTMPNTDVTITAVFKSQHKTILIKGKAPTCTECGWRDYYQCKVCGDLFADEEGTQLIENLEAWKIGEGKIEKTGHSLILIKGKAPTCTEDGWKDYYRCSACGDLFMDEAGTEPITNFEEWKIGEGKLPVIAHPLKLVKGKAPTLVEPGYKDYYRCPKCGDYFEDKDGTIKIIDLEEWKVTKGALGPIMGAKNLTITLLVIVAVIIVPIITVVSVIEIKKRRYLHVNNNYLFSDIKYSRTTHPTAPSLDEHTFDFIYQGEHVYYYIFTRKVDKVTDKEVKAKFQEILKSGKLRKYSSHYYKKIY